MKNAFFSIGLASFLAWFASPQEVLGQVTLIDAPDTIFVSLDTLSASDYVDVQWDVVNDFETSVELMVTRGLVSTVTPWNNSEPWDPQAGGSYDRFCWGTSCFEPGTSSSPSQGSWLVGLNPGDVDTTFHSYFYPEGVFGTSTLRYCFHEPDDILAGSCHIITFVVDGTAGVTEDRVPLASLTALSPNPASNEVTVSFDRPMRGELEFRNLVGQVHKTEWIGGHGLQQTFSLDGMSSGIWLVTYKVDGVAASTKRLVIR